MAILAGDVGGSKTLLALVERAGRGVRILHQARFKSPTFAGLAPIVSKFQAIVGQPV